MHYKHIFFLILLCAFSSSLLGMTFDNRHFPLIDKPIFRHDDVQFFVRAQPFVFFANSSWGNQEDEDSIGLFETDGKLNQNDWDDVLFESGSIKRKLVPPNFSYPFVPIPWHQGGKFDAGGLALHWYYTLTCHLEFGGSFFVMGMRSRLESLLKDDNSLADVSNPLQQRRLDLSTGDVRDLQTAFNEQRKAAHLDGFLWSRAGVSDLDLYLRLFDRRHYFWRCKTLDTAIKLGLIVPTASRRDIDNPASFPFGGNGLWGGYFDFAVDSELKDDIFAGFNFRFIQRFGKTETMRLPIRQTLFDVPHEKKNEKAEELGISEFHVPLSFNPLIAPVHISPGFTFVFLPYAAITNYRDGFGAQISYNLILHTRDKFSHVQSNTKAPVDLDVLNRRSSWGSEYVTFGINYDFAKDRECRGALPMVFLEVDYPVHFFVAKRSNKTFGVSLRVESDLW